MNFGLRSFPSRWVGENAYLPRAHCPRLSNYLRVRFRPVELLSPIMSGRARLRRGRFERKQKGVFKLIPESPTYVGLIQSVEPDSLAAEMGLHPGDEVLTVNGHPVEDVIDVQFYAAEDVVEITYRRGENQQSK